MVSELSASGWRMKHPPSIEHFNFICDSFFIFIADLRYLSRKTIFWKKIGPLGGVISKFSEKTATKFWFIVPQEFYIANLEVRFLANILIPSFYPAKFRVMWFQPVENAYSAKKSGNFSKNFVKRKKIFSKVSILSLVLVYRDDFESF